MNAHEKTKGMRQMRFEDISDINNLSSIKKKLAD